jgi:hypothetical protein
MASVGAAFVLYFLRDRVPLLLSFVVASRLLKYLAQAVAA